MLFYTVTKCFYTVTKCSATNLLVFVLSFFYIDKSKHHQEVSTFVIIGFDLLYNDLSILEVGGMHFSCLFRE